MTGQVGDHQPARGIRELNDRLRTSGRGGRVVITSGVEGLGKAGQWQVLVAVATFDAFTENNDPHDEHDCALLTVGSDDIIWKIDYFDRTLENHSPDPSDESVTTRVLTIMLASEY